MNERQQLIAMLDRAGVSYDVRADINPPVVCVMIAAVDQYTDDFWHTSEWIFDANGLLTSVVGLDGDED